MNKRIKELSEQATSYSKEGFYTYQKFDEQKFAELIVRECAEVINAGKVGYNQVPAELALDMTAKTVKEYFGVE